METIRIKDKQFDLFIPEQQLREAIARLAARIKADLDGRNPLYVCILNGAYMFAAELMRELNTTDELTFARYSSYKGLNSTGTLNEIMPLEPELYRGRTVVLLEDVIDSGLTMYTLMNKLRAGGALDVRLATMLFKPSSLAYNFDPDYVGMTIPDVFIVGHGLDYLGEGRALRDVYKLSH